MKRRKALQVISLGALAQAAGAAGPVLLAANGGFAWKPGGYQLRFFTPEENRLLDALMDLIIPADGHSPGAHAAEVSLFADVMVSTSGPDEQRRWRSGLRAMREAAGDAPVAAALAIAARGEGSPVSELERFFVLVKQMTVDGYYTSEIGLHQDLNYLGNDYLDEFRGCGHAEHR